MHDKRDHLRVAINMAVRCEVEGDVHFDALATDISIGGARVEASELPEIGRRLVIAAQLPGAKEVSRLPAVVRWNQTGSFGVQFGLLGARDTHRIAGLMGQAMRTNKTT